MDRDILVELEDFCDPQNLLPKAFDSAILGTCHVCGEGFTAAYDLTKVLTIIQDAYFGSKEKSINIFNNEFLNVYHDVSFVEYIDDYDMISIYNEQMLLLSGDENFKPVGVRFKYKMRPVAVYDREQIIEDLINMGMPGEDAIEHYEFNIAGSYVGENTPAMISVFDEFTD